MTPEQKEKILGLVFGFSAVGSAALFVVLMFTPIAIDQAMAYAAFGFLLLFVVIRWAMFRVARRYD